MKYKFKSKQEPKPSLEGLFEQYNSKQTKNNPTNTLLKSVVDVASSVAGTGVSALSGEKSLLAGFMLIVIGHYLGDKSGLLRTTGVSTIAHGIAKSKAYRNNPDLTTPKQRMVQLKDDLLTSLYLNWEKETSEAKTKEEENKAASQTKENTNPTNNTSEND